MPFRYLDDITLADVACEAWGASFEAVAAAAVDASVQVMLPDLGQLGRDEVRRVDLAADAWDMLLFRLLEEILFYKDAEQILLRVDHAVVTSSDSGCPGLRVELRGERSDPARHELGGDVKAVTLHRLSVEHSSEGWRATVVLDV